LHKLLAVLAVLVTLYCQNSFADSLEVRILPGSSDQQARFYPEILPFGAWDTITWVNEDSEMHKIVSGVPSHPDYAGTFFMTEPLESGKSSLIQTKELTNFAYYYLCEIHPWLTGKLVLETAQESQAETKNPISTDRKHYATGQQVSVGGQVHSDFGRLEYQILVYDDQKLIEVRNGIFDDDGTYTDTIHTLVPSKYTIKIAYGLPTQIAKTTFEVSEPLIPSWVRSDALWWASGQISDGEFAKLVHYLARQNIFQIQNAKLVQSDIAEIKSSALWWADGIISDSEFVGRLESLPS
jgi:plastocyanin